MALALVREDGKGLYLVAGGYKCRPGAAVGFSHAFDMSDGGLKPGMKVKARHVSQSPYNRITLEDGRKLVWMHERTAERLLRRRTDIVERLRDLDYMFTNAVCDELRTEAADEIENLRTRLAGAERDAKRYRALRSQFGREPPGMFQPVFGMYRGTNQWKTEGQLDEAVDAIAPQSTVTGSEP